MSGGKRLLRAFGSAMGSRLGIAVLNYGLFWSLAHLLDAQRLGGFSLLINVFFLLQMLPLLGLSVPVMRRISVLPEAPPDEVANAFFFALPVSALIAVAVGLAGSHLYGAALAAPFWLVALSMLPTAWTIVAEAALIGKERYGDVARVTLIESLLRTALALLAVHWAYGLTGVFAVFAAMRVLAAVLYGFHPGLPLPRRRLYDRALQRRNWHEVPVFLGIALVSAALTRLDVIVLSSLRGLGDVGVYAAASRLYEASLMVPTVLALVVMPVLARQLAHARAQFRATLGVVVRLCLTAALALAIPASAFADWAVQLLYKPEMAAAGAVLAWLVFASAIMLTDVVLSSTMLAAGAQKHDLHALSLSLAVLVAGLLLLIPHFGPTGAAAAVVAALAARIAMRLRWATHEFDLPAPWLALLRTGAALACGLAALAAVQPFGAFAQAGCGLAAYAAVLALWAALRRHPLQALRDDIALLKRKPQA